MINFLKACFFTVTIWVLAALINALLYSLVFVLGDLIHLYFGDAFGKALFFSLFFSAPGIFCFWLVFVTGTHSEHLPKRLLKAAFIISLCSCAFIAVLPPKVYGGHGFILACIIIFSSVVSVYCITGGYTAFNLKLTIMYKCFSSFRAAILVWLTHSMALPLLQIIRRPHRIPYTKEELWQMPDGTLGKELVRMLDKNKLDLLPYYMKHDIKHILLGYSTTADGEVCLQCFMLGNGHISFPVAATIGFGVLTMPEYWPVFYAAFKRGKRTASLSKWNWHSLLPLTVVSIIEKLNTPRNHTHHQIYLL